MLGNLILLLTSYQLFLSGVCFSEEECVPPPPLGMTSGDIPDHMISASSENVSRPARDARFDMPGSWCALRSVRGEWLEVDLGRIATLVAVATQGNGNDSWVKAFNLQFSADNVTWYCDRHEGKIKEFPANTDGESSFTNTLFSPPHIRYLRFYPSKWNENICMRVEIYGCDLDSATAPSFEGFVSGKCILPPTTAPTEGTTVPPTSPTTQPPEPIQGIRIRLQSVATTGKNVLIALFPHAGTDPVYHWDMGNGETTVTFSKVFWYSFRSAGVFEVSATASNTVNNVTKKAVIVVQDPIQRLQFTKRPTAVTPYQRGTVLWKVNRGTNVTFTIRFGDSSHSVTMESHSVGLGPVTISYSYNVTGAYVISITAKNRISKSVITDLVYVEEKVAGLKINVTLPRALKGGARDVYIAVGEQVTVDASIESGTDVNFLYIFGERIIKSSSSSVNFKYTSTGTNMISVKCSNRINFQSVGYPLPIVVQKDEKLEGLALKVFPAILGYPSIFALTFISGKAFLCSWNFGDGSKVQTDDSDLQTTQNHTYSKIGAYTVDVNCLNRHGSSFTSTTANVQTQITGLSIHTNSRYLPVNGTAVYIITIQSGSHVGFQVNFDDGMKLQRAKNNRQNKTLKIKHTFTKAGSFRAEVIACNELGFLVASADIMLVVQDPIRYTTLTCRSPVKFAEANVKYQLSLVRPIKPPTNASCLWRFGDGIETKTKLEVKYTLPQEREHTFRTAGFYTTSVVCTNYVSKVNFTVQLHVYEMVTPKLTVFTVLGNKTISSRAPPTLSKYGCFEIEDEVVFHVTSQMYDLEYLWQIKSLNFTMKTTKSEFRFSFPRPGKYRVEVTIDNKLEIFKMWTELRIEKRISILRFDTRSSTTVIRHVTQIIIETAKIGTDPCILVDFNDTSNRIMFGETICRTRRGYQYVHLIKTLNDTIRFDHLYLHKGIYHLNLLAFNLVSEVHKTTSVEVITPPCVVRNLTLTGPNGTGLLTYIQKRKSISLELTFFKECLLSDKSEIYWGVYRAGESRKAISAFGVKEFVIQKRRLEYGAFRIEAVVYLYGAHVTDVYGIVKGEVSRMVQIVASPLVAYINGSKERSVGYETSFTLDGSRSHDPDSKTPFRDFQLIFKWYCKVKDKNGVYTGCYNNNPSVSFSNAKVFNTDSANMLQGKTYIYRLEVRKVHRSASFEQRVLIVMGAPPDVEIRCESNCEKKLNPNKNLVVKVVCTDCLRTSGLQYEWQLFKGHTAVQNLAASTASGVKESSLTVFSSLLTTGQTYRIDVSVRKYGGTPGNATIRVHSNEPPVPGACSAQPASGEAMKTQFEIRCQGWYDPDVPLTYTFMYEKDGDVSSVSSDSVPSTRAMLPVGVEEDDHNLKLLVRVTDALGLSSQQLLRVKVKQPKNVNLSSIMGNIGDIGGSTVDKDKAIQSITTLSNFLNSLADKDKSTGGPSSGGHGSSSSNGDLPTEHTSVSTGGGLGTSSPGEDPEVRRAREEQLRKQKEEEKRQRTEMRDQIIKQVSSINITSLDDVSLATNAFKQVTKQTDEISAKSLETTMNSMENMKDLLTQSFKGSTGNSGSSGAAGNVDSKKLEAVSTNVISVLGNLLGAMQGQNLWANTNTDANGQTNGNHNGVNESSSSGNDTQKLSPMQKKQKELKQRITRVIDMIEQIASVILSTKTPGDDPTIIVTDHVLVRIQRHWTKSIGNTSLLLRNGMFKLSQPQQLFGTGNRTNPEVIDSIMFEFPKNPFAWDSSVNVDTPVVLLQLRNVDGTPLNISYPSENVHVLLNRTTLSRPRYTEIFHLTYNMSKVPFQVHKFNRSSSQHAIYIEIYVLETQTLEWTFLVDVGQRPTLQRHRVMWTVFVANTTTSNVPYTYFILPGDLPGIGEFYLAIAPKLREDLRKEWRSGKLNLSYALVIYQTSCRHWNKNAEIWSTAGCKVGPSSSLTIAHCLCNHTASFGSDLEVLINTVDPAPDEIRDESVHPTLTPATDSPTVVALISTLFGVYLIGIIWAWRKDIMDTKRAKPFPLLDNDRDDNYEYMISVYTGSQRKAATTANVGCVLVGKYGMSDARSLYDPRFPIFQKSGVDSFQLKTDFDLGDLQHLQIWHDNTGEKPSWFLSQVIVEDVTNNVTYVFICDDWLAVESTDGKIEREILPATPSQLQQFRYLFHKFSHIADSHLWFSVFARPVSSTFTRVQRLSCCLFFISSVMLFNALFIGIDRKSSPLISKDYVLTGVISCAIMIPVKLGIVSIFRLAASKPKRDSPYQTKGIANTAVSIDGDSMDLNDALKHSQASENNQTEGLDFEENIIFEYPSDNLKNERYGFATDENAVDEIPEQAQFAESDYYNRADQWDVDFSIYDEKVELPRFRPCTLPPWSVYVAWTIVVIISLTSATLVSYYGFTFGEQKILQWITSVLVSIFVDMLIVQPLEVLLQAVYVAVVLKQAPELAASQRRRKDRICDVNHPCCLEEKEDSRHTRAFWFPYRFTEEDLTKARDLKLLEIKSIRMLKEIIVYLLFLISLFVVSFGQRDPLAFPVAKSVEDTYLNGVYSGTSLVQGDSLQLYWVWLENTVLPTLSALNRNWAVGCQPESNYTMECNSILVGAARLRQLRTTPESCSVPGPMRNVVSGCSAYHSFLGEDEANYDPGWELPNNNTGPFNDSRRFWRFRNSSDLNEVPYLGLMSTYGGGGYAIDMPRTGEAKHDLEDLRNKKWIDKRTRAVFIEISIYNAQVNLFAIAIFLTEWLPTNGVIFFNNIKVARLYRYGNNSSLMTVVCEIFMVVIMSVLIYNTVKNVYRLRRAYLRDKWNLLELLTILLFLGSLAAFFNRSRLTDKAIADMKEDQNVFVSLSPVATWDELLTYLLGSLVFFANIKLLKMIRFNHRVYVLSRTLAISCEPLGSFMVVFLVFYIAYAQFVYLVFGGSLDQYASFIVTLESLFNTIMGGFDFMALEESDKVLGPIFFFSFMMSMVMILMNVFLAILMDSFVEACEEDLQSTERECLDYFEQKIAEYFSRRNAKIEESCSDLKENESVVDVVQSRADFDHFSATTTDDAESVNKIECKTNRSSQPDSKTTEEDNVCCSYYDLLSKALIVSRQKEEQGEILNMNEALHYLDLGENRYKQSPQTFKFEVASDVAYLGQQLQDLQDGFAKVIENDSLEDNMFNKLLLARCQRIIRTKNSFSSNTANVNDMALSKQVSVVRMYSRHLDLTPEKKAPEYEF